MKDLFLRFCRWVLPFLGVSTVISCDNVINGPDMYGTQVAEYGVPVMEYKVTGKVTDEYSGNPVKGIEVIPEDANVLVYTSEDGEFTCEGATFPDDKVTITFKDIDGEENGVYATKEIEVPVKKSEDGSGWFAGVYIADDVLVKLMPDDVVTPEYGVPVVEFSIKGKVMDVDFNPIENIEVVLEGFDEDALARTSSAGTFICEGQLTDMEKKEIVIHFIDTDGKENGGEFLEETVTVPLAENGEITTESVAVIMEKKSDDNQDDQIQPTGSLEFSIAQNVDDVDFSKYQEKYGLMGGREYYGLGYKPTVGEDGHQIDPEHCVIYTVSSYPDYADKAQHITMIYITDPKVEAYGINLNTSFDEFQNILESQGYTRDDTTNENCITMRKDKFSISLTHDWIIIRVEVENKTGIIF